MATKSTKFYQCLNNLSTADFLPINRRQGTGPFYEIERIISRRKGKRGEHEYFLKWKGYNTTSNSWESEINLNAKALRSFHQPSPTEERIISNTEAIHIGLLEHLNSRSSNPTIILLEHDVARYLFGTKALERIMELEKCNFMKCAFPTDWDRLFDRIGDGVQIEFPVRIRLFIAKSAKNHTMRGKEVVPLPRHQIEKASIAFNKVACSLN